MPGGEVVMYYYEYNAMLKYDVYNHKIAYLYVCIYKFYCSTHIFTYQSSLDELFLACLSVLLLATPGLEGGGLQSAAI